MSCVPGLRVRSWAKADNIPALMNLTVLERRDNVQIWNRYGVVRVRKWKEGDIGGLF